jgi:hypothetical protein
MSSGYCSFTSPGPPRFKVEKTLVGIWICRRIRTTFAIGSSASNGASLQKSQSSSHSSSTAVMSRAPPGASNYPEAGSSEASDILAASPSLFLFSLEMLGATLPQSRSLIWLLFGFLLFLPFSFDGNQPNLLGLTTACFRVVVHSLPALRARGASSWCIVLVRENTLHCDRHSLCYLPFSAFHSTDRCPVDAKRVA